MDGKRKFQQGLSPKRSNPSRPRNWQEFFDLARSLRLPDDFLAERGDTPPQKRRLFARHAINVGSAIFLTYVRDGGASRRELDTQPRERTVPNRRAIRERT